MLTAVIELLIAVSLLVFFLSKYINIKQLAFARNLWSVLETNFEFCRSWKFQSVIFILMLAMFVTFSDQLEANKLGINSTELNEFKASAARYNLSLEDYKSGLEISKNLNFKNFNEYLQAKNAGFQDSQSWGEAQRLRTNTFVDYQAEVEKMKARGFSNIDNYIAHLNKEAEALAAKEKAKQEAFEATQAQKDTRTSSTSSWHSSDGRSESDWTSLCRRHQAARSDCAASGAIGSCVEIKLGGAEPAGMANMYCNEGSPNFSLMGRR